MHNKYYNEVLEVSYSMVDRVLSFLNFVIPKDY